MTAEVPAFDAKAPDLLRRRQFESKFNALVDALLKFSDAYNKGGGAVWPLKEANAVHRAYHDLERSSFMGKPSKNLPGSVGVDPEAVR
jgi:hypothetical protein